MPESFSSILQAIADEGRERMRPHPPEAVHALGRARRRRRNAAIAVTAAFVACAVAAGVVLGAGHSHGAAPLPPGQTTPGAVKNTSPGLPPTPGGQSASPLPFASTGEPGYVPDVFLSKDELPDAAAFHWSSIYVGSGRNALPSIGCDSAVYEVSAPTVPSHATSAQYARYLLSGSMEAIDETVYTYQSDSDAYTDLNLITPAKGACAHGSFTTRSDDGFGWTQTGTAGGSPLSDHYVVARRGNRLAVLLYQQLSGQKPHDVSGDAAVLLHMASRLTKPPIPDSAFMTPDKIPFGDGQGWAAAIQTPRSDISKVRVTDLCASASDPVNTDDTYHAGWQSLTPALSAAQFWSPLNRPGAPPATEHIHLFGTNGESMAIYGYVQKLTKPSSCTTSRKITPGVNSSTGFSIVVSDTSEDRTHIYVVWKNNDIAVLAVPVTNTEATDFSHDADVLTAVRDQLP